MDQKTSDSGKKKTLDLAGPEILSCKATHRLGPFAAKSGKEITLSPLRFTLKNTSSKAISIRSIDVDPLHREADGTSVRADIDVPLESGKSYPAEVKPEKDLQFRLEGNGVLPPGRYQSKLRISRGDADTAQTILLTVNVQAHWLWAMSFMFLGLMVLGVSAFLAGEAKVRDLKADVHAERQRAYELIDRKTLPRTDRSLADQVIDTLNNALKVLNERRALGLEDSRIKRANRSLIRGRELFKDLRSRVNKGRAGSVEVAGLEKQYTDLKKRTEALDMLLPSVKAMPAMDDAFLADLVGAFQQNQWHRNFDTLRLVINKGFGPHVVRAHLALAAGEGERAQRMAVTIRRWLGRTARYIDRSAAMMLAWRMWSNEMVVRRQALARLLQRPDFPDQGRTEVSDLVDRARTALAKERSLQAFQSAYSALQSAETAALRWESRQVVEDIRVGVQEVMAKTSTGKIEKTIAGLTPDDGPEVRRLNILKILDLWQERVETCEDPEHRERLFQQVASLKTLNRKDDKAALALGLKELYNQWSAYQDGEINRSKRKILGPLCARLTASLYDQINTTGEALLLLQPHLRTQTAEQALDRVRLQLQNTPQDAECLQTAIGLHKTVNDVNTQLFKTIILISGGSPEAGLAAAKHAGDAEAIVLARRLMTEPRPLLVTLRTPEDELFVQQQIAVAIEDLHPNWGPGVQMEIDFGDGTPLLEKNAEQIRQETIVTHRYTSPMRAVVTVKAKLGGDAMSHQPVGDIIGEGQHTLSILPSPISKALAMAGLFFNLRFFLAVVIGFLVQTWQFYGQPSFGGQGTDYVKAFAIGFSVNFGLEGLAGLLNSTMVGG